MRSAVSLHPTPPSGALHVMYGFVLVGRRLSAVSAVLSLLLVPGDFSFRLWSLGHSNGAPGPVR